MSTSLPPEDVGDLNMGSDLYNPQMTPEGQCKVCLHQKEYNGPCICECHEPNSDVFTKKVPP